MANQVDFKILPSDQFNVYSPQTRSDKIITYFTLLSKLRGDILAVAQEDDPNDIISAYYSNVGGTQTLHLVKADGSEVIASQPQQVISGTLNYVSKFTSANDIGDSQIFDDGTNVGIGTTSMTHKLQLGAGGVFADYYQLDTTYSNGFVVGAISWDSDNGTADIGLSSTLKLKVGQDDVWYVKNQTGSSIAKGTAVYANGTLGASGRITIAPMIADGTIPARFFLGIVAETIANGADGYVLNKGKLRQINTNAYNEGDVLWVSPTTAGTLTNVEPTAPNLKLPVAFVVYKANNGILAVRATTGQRIEDASDVDYTGAADNSFLVYDLASGVWVDEAVGIFKTISVATQDPIVADIYDDTLTLVAGTNVTITTNAGTDTITINSTDEFVGTVTSVATTAPITGGPITTTGTIGITQSGAATDGYLSSTDWNTFNDKEPALTKGDLTEVTSAVLTVTNGTNAVIGSGTSIQVAQSSSTTDGYLSSTDWSTFNGKASNSFTTIAVATQSNIVAGSATDTLTIAAGTGVTITTDDLTDTLTISATGSGGTVTSIDTTAPITGGTITDTGTIGITQSGAAADGYLSSTDWNTFNDKQDALTFSAPLVNTSGTISISQSGAATDGYLSSTDWNTFNGKQDAITLTTTGNSGAATFVSSTLNIPEYTLIGLGGVPTTRTLTINGTAFDLSADRSWSVGTVTSVDLTAGTGISVSGGPITSSGSITVTNDDRGSSQNIFKNINVITSQDWDDSDFVWNTDDGSWSSGIDQSSIVADSNNDTLYIESVGGISITTDATTDTIYFDNIDKGSEQNIFKNIVVGSDTITADSNDDTITFVSGTGISVSANVSTDTLTITNNDKGSTQNIFKNIAVSGQSTIVADGNDDTLTVVAGTGISITTSAATDTLTITNTGTPSLALANSINYVPASSAFWYPVTGSYATIVMDTTNRARLAAPVSVDDANRILATVTLEVANTGSAGFCTIGIQLYNNTDAVPVAKSLHTWTAYLDANQQDSSYTLFTLHFPIDDLDVDYGDDIDVQVISIASTQEIMAFRYSLVAVTAA